MASYASSAYATTAFSTDAFDIEDADTLALLLSYQGTGVGAIGGSQPRSRQGTAYADHALTPSIQGRGAGADVGPNPGGSYQGQGSGASP
jgi:hypothetical protein